MRKFTICLTLISASCLAACGKTGNAGDGSGYALLHPAAATRVFILANDRPFAEEVGAHNAQCRKDQGCAK